MENMWKNRRPLQIIILQIEQIYLDIAHGLFKHKLIQVEAGWCI